jgi:hypothetical protein
MMRLDENGVFFLYENLFRNWHYDIVFLKELHWGL